MSEQEKENLNIPYKSPEGNRLKEFTLKALILGLIMSVILGAANAYLGLKAGMTIAATYPAAVIGMAILRLFRNSTILEENIARTVGSIGESVAAGAIFTIPAFLISGVWEKFDSPVRYLEASAIMILGGIIGILFVTILRRVMVADRELPFPESVAASEIHKAGRSGGSGAGYLFGALGIGALIQALKNLNFFAATWEKFIYFPKSLICLKKGTEEIANVSGGGGALLSTPGVSPAYIGVGYIIGPTLASLNFSGGLLAWGLFVPLLIYFLGPTLESTIPINASPHDHWVALAYGVWKFIVRPVAIGGMLVSAVYTLYRMRKSLYNGLKHAIADIKKVAGQKDDVKNTEKDISFKFVFPALILASILTFFLYNYFSQNALAALIAALVMIIAGFFFAAVSGYLVGLIGSSNNPISGLTLSTLIVAAFLMVLLGMKGNAGVIAVLGVASVVCVSAAVAGEMLQDLKVGHILGGTPWRMQVGDIIGVIIASLVMYFPLLVLHQGDINIGGTGFGGKALPAPQASLMAMLSQGIVAGQMAWPLIIVGMLLAIGMILLQVRSPMLVCVGMYLPLETSFAIFIGGVIRWLVDLVADRKKFNDPQKARMSNNGILLASGLIAGEALIGLVFATLAFMKIDYLKIMAGIAPYFANPSFIPSILVFIFIGWLLVYIPIKNAGSPDEPAPQIMSM